jgi:predicted nucleic acid-binding protein
VIAIIDASVALKWFLKEDGRSDAVALLGSNISLVAPDLIFSEFANVIWQKARRNGHIGRPRESGHRHVDRDLPEFDIVSRPCAARVRDGART